METIFRTTFADGTANWKGSRESTNGFGIVEPVLPTNPDPSLGEYRWELASTCVQGDRFYWSWKGTHEDFGVKKPHKA